jgi:hypothetical protein
MTALFHLCSMSLSLLKKTILFIFWLVLQNMNQHYCAKGLSQGDAAEETSTLILHMRNHNNKLEDSRREGDLCGRHHQDHARLYKDRRVTHHHLEAQEEFPRGGPPRPPETGNLERRKRSSQGVFTQAVFFP